MSHLIQIEESLTSAAVLRRLRSEADALGRPPQRHATIDRLVEACDAIADGSAADVLRRASSSDPSLKKTFEIHYKRGTPVAVSTPRIDEYVKARRLVDLGQGCLKSAWTGPTSAVIRGDEGLRLYVHCREREQGLKKSALKRRGLDADIDMITDMDGRQRVWFAIQEGQEAKRQLALLKKGLMTIPGINVYALLGQPDAQAMETQPPSPSTDLKASDLDALAELLKRLTDPACLSGFELIFDGSRIKHKVTKETLIDKTALAALQVIARSGRREV